MNKEWLDFINAEMQKDYMVNLKSFIDSERQSNVVHPSANITFNHMNFCPYDRLKVVIIGNAPFNDYINDGLAFSVIGHNHPEENKNIIYEAFRDYFKAWSNTGEIKNKLFPTSQLTEWAKQGVLLVNSIYTCTDKDRFAHKDKGWETFNENLIEKLNDYHLPLVFINKCTIYDYTFKINPKKHLIINSNDVNWCTKANDFIRNRKVSIDQQHYQLKINWLTKPLNV